MMELVMHTEKNDTVFHTEKTGMLRLVVEIDVGGMTADVVDKDGQHGTMGLVGITWEGSRGTWGCEGMDLVQMGCRELPVDEGATVYGIGREFQLGLL
nr:hypothetical protein [Tanacetum cinerariifolium]